MIITQFEKKDLFQLQDTRLAMRIQNGANGVNGATAQRLADLVATAVETDPVDQNQTAMVTCLKARTATSYHLAVR